MIWIPLLVEIKPREVYKKQLCRNQDDSGAKSAQRECHSGEGTDRVLKNAGNPTTTRRIQDSQVSDLLRKQFMHNICIHYESAWLKQTVGLYISFL